MRLAFKSGKEQALLCGLHALTEALGIGHITILDSTLVLEADLGVNFFLEESSIGGFRAEHCCNLLKELNPDVQGSYITEVRKSTMLLGACAN